jgi:hypothetical protein
MVAIYFGMMRHGATKMNRNLAFGQMARQVVVGYETAKAEVNDSLEIIYFIFSSRQEARHFCLLTDSGFHILSIDIFECDENHTMDSEHFFNWIDRTAPLLQKKLGNLALILCLPIISSDTYLGEKAKVVQVLGNATWHNRLTKDTLPPKR